MVRDKVVSVSRLSDEYVVRKDRVRLALAFEHKRPSSAEAQFDASLVYVLRKRLPVGAVLREAYGGDAVEAVLLRFEDALLARYVSPGRQYLVFDRDWHMPPIIAQVTDDDMHKTIIIGF